jgi:microcystin-dependent protein
MAQPYVGEVRLFAGNFAPAGWQFCDGSLLPISENETLFNLIGTTFGGDGQSTFAVPDLRGRLPIHLGQGQGLSNRTLGQAAGTESVTLTIQQIPNHTHPMVGSTSLGQDTSPAGKVVAQIGAGALPYIQDSTDTNLNAAAVLPAGGSLPHDNLQPFLCISFIISLFGIFPSQT